MVIVGCLDVWLWVKKWVVVEVRVRERRLREQNGGCVCVVW